MTIIVTGGREYKDRRTFKQVMRMLKVTAIVEGGAKGADRMAWLFRKKNKLGGYTEQAKWQQYDNSAGPIRNEKMLDDNPKAIVVAFPGNSGTAHCVREAKKRGMIVLKVQKR